MEDDSHHILGIAFQELEEFYDILEETYILEEEIRENKNGASCKKNSEIKDCNIAEIWMELLEPQGKISNILKTNYGLEECGNKEIEDRKCCNRNGEIENCREAEDWEEVIDSKGAMLSQIEDEYIRYHVIREMANKKISKKDKGIKDCKMAKAWMELLHLQGKMCNMLEANYIIKEVVGNVVDKKCCLGRYFEEIVLIKDCEAIDDCVTLLNPHKGRYKLIQS